MRSTEQANQYAVIRRQNLRTLAALANRVGVALGMDGQRFVASMRRLPQFIHDWRVYQRGNRNSSFRASLLDCFPILHDADGSAGDLKGHYFHQDLWAARKIYAHRPESHLDIGSRIDGFVAHLLTFMPVSVVDLRSLEGHVPGLTFVKCDATDLSHLGDSTVPSLSSLHAAEHFGLGRYGDRIDPDGSFRFMRALSRVLTPGGRLYFSVPIGVERVEFNAHRILAPATVLKAFSMLRLLSCACVDDRGVFHDCLTPETIPQCQYGCGMFEFVK